MNERPTPETDANECWPASNLKLGKSSVVPSNIARKLERDEAREALAEAWRFADLWLAVADHYLKQINEWIRKN